MCWTDLLSMNPEGVEAILQRRMSPQEGLGKGTGVAPQEVDRYGEGIDFPRSSLDGGEASIGLNDATEDGIVLSRRSFHVSSLLHLQLAPVAAVCVAELLGVGSRPQAQEAWFLTL